MTEQTITFTPQADLRKGLYTVGRGLAIIVKAVAGIFNASVHRHPYPYLLVVVILSAVFSAVCIISARAERDAALKKQYHLQQQVEQLSNVVETYKQ